MGIEVQGLLGLILLVLDIWVILKVIQSPSGTGAKVAWIVIVILFPFLGPLLWFLLGRK